MNETLEEYDTLADNNASYGLDLANMDPEQRARLEEEWNTELVKTEEEIQTLRQVLNSKLKHSQELKRKLGISVWKEFQQDLGQGVKSIQETTAYQKTSEVAKTASEKFGSFGSSLTRKLGDVRNSNTFKSFEERVSSTVSTVKTRMTGSRSNSVNSFEEALNSTDRQHSQTATPATTPTVPENKATS